MDVFVVEDSRAVRTLIVRRLRGIGGLTVVGEAEGELEAIDSVLRLGPHIVLLDLDLARGGSGVHVLRQLRREGYKGKIIIVSNQAALGNACVAAGADAYYDKASGLDTLFDDVSNLAEERPLTSSRPSWPTSTRLACAA